MFVGRREELESLETAYQKGSFQFAVVYGRRRVGKTSLLRVFTQGKPHVIFFTGQQTVASENLALLSREILGNSAARSSVPLYPGCTRIRLRTRQDRANRSDY